MTASSAYRNSARVFISIGQFGLFFWLALFGQTSPAHASNASPPIIRYNLCELPSTQAAARTLTEETSLLWDQRPLRDGLAELTSIHGISIWLDRRIDPTQTISFTAKASDADRSLAHRLEQIAALAAAEALLIENVIYFGPRGEPAKLQYAAVSLHDAIGVASRGANAQMRGLAWKELATPDDILRSIAEAWNVQLESSLPYDLYHAGELVRPCTLATQLTLVCGGFSKRPTLQSQSIGFEDLPNDTSWQCAYARTSLNSRAIQPASISKMKQIYPGSSLRCQADQCIAQGTTSFHLALLQPIVVKRGHAIERELAMKWDFEVLNKPSKTVIDSLANSTGLTIQWDKTILADHQAKLISFNVKGASLDSLLQAFAKASGLTVTREGQSIWIKP